MRLPAVISALILLGSLTIGGYVWSVRPAEEVKLAAGGMDILRAYKCRRSETKTIIVRGVEDNHSPAGSEPNFLREGRRFPDTQSYYAGGSYDQVQPDLRMTDSFQAPANTARGLFLIRLKPVTNNDSDTIAIGDLSTMAHSGASRGRSSSSIVGLANLPGWSRQNEFHFAELAAIRLYRPAGKGFGAITEKLLDFIRGGTSDGWVDFAVQDDTSVDFAGIALCLEPPGGKGVTMTPEVYRTTPVPGLVSLSCGFGGRDQYNCDPYIGDTQCTSQLPVACFHADEKPLPKALVNTFAQSQWSGGRLAFTEPMAGSRFSTAGEVDGVCGARFGSGWRAARWHDGPGNLLGIAGISAQAIPSGRVWIDVVGKPYATCWTR